MHLTVLPDQFPCLTFHYLFDSFKIGIFIPSGKSVDSDIPKYVFCLSIFFDIHFDGCLILLAHVIDSIFHYQGEGACLLHISPFF